MGIRVFHMEAGNRCYDDRVPEEVNRRVIDHSSDVLMPYTNRSKDNLLREGIHPSRVYVTGNPIFEVLQCYKDQIDVSRVLERLGLVKWGYILATAHRAENVDDPTRLAAIMESLSYAGEVNAMPVMCSLHPRTLDKMTKFGVQRPPNVLFHEPLGLFDFVHLEKYAACVITDSGTVQEECCILGVPSITIRDTTERPETIEAGSNALAGVGKEDVRRTLKVVMPRRPWNPPQEYVVPNVSEVVARIILGFCR
jgi:UDP-N-acetylglucosamine 2-epimerase (non-hydrolysing)